MAQVLAIPHDRLSPSQAKRSSFSSSGRGGSGNIRRAYITANADRAPDSPSSPRVRQGPSADAMVLRPAPPEPPAVTERRDVEKLSFTSTGRGGAGNVQLSAAALQAHPLTAAILSQHNAMQAQHEKRVRKVYADTNVIRSSGRGGSGNISDPRRRSSSQELRTASKRHFFTTKGRERDLGCDLNGTAQAQDGQERRASRATYSSGGSSALDTMYSHHTEETRLSNAMMSSDSAISDPLAGEDPETGQPRKRQGFLIRWNRSPSTMTSLLSPAPGPARSPPPTISVSPPSFHARSRCSSPVILEDRQEYVSFLEM